MQNKRKIALFDIDGTIYNGATIFPLLNLQLQEKFVSQETVDNINAHRELYKKGKYDYEEYAQILVTAWAAGLQDQSSVEVAHKARLFLLSDSKNFYPFIKPLLALFKNSYDTFI